MDCEKYYDISISLNVVNIALTFCASFNLDAIFNRILFILTLCSVLVPVISFVGSWGGTLTVAASKDWACRIAATGIWLTGAAAGLGGGGGAAGFGGAVGVGAADDCCGGGGGGGGAAKIKIQHTCL